MILKSKKTVLISKQGKFYTTRIEGLAKSIKMHKNKREAINYAKQIARVNKWLVKEIN